MPDGLMPGADHAPEGEIIIDSFAGGGGASTGIELALGRSPDIAVNHDAQAIALHRANHPDTMHVTQDIWQVDPREIVGRRPVGLAWFSPDCKHFSKAKGATPVERHIRDLAWVVVTFAQRVRPRVIILENVEEFRTWGPLLAQPDGTLRPCPERKGETWERWLAAMRKLGYRVEWRELRACDYGAPTIRKRLFVIARRDKRPIIWPEPTHGKPSDPDVIAGRKLPWRPAAEIIDWSLPCPSIFDTAEEIMARWGVRANRPLKPATLARIARGIDRYVLRAAKPFLVRVDQASAAGRAGVHDADEPVRTATTAGGLAAVVPHMAVFRHDSAGSDIAAPMPTVTAGSWIKRPGGNIPLGVVATYVDRQFGQSVGHASDDPLGTVTAGAGGKAALVGCGGRAGQSRPRGVDEPTQTGTAKADACVVSAGLLHLKGSDRRDRDVEAPAPAACAGGMHIAEVRAFLTQYYGSGGQDAPVDEPMRTATAKDRLGLVTVEGVDYIIADIGMRMLTARELFRAQGFPESYRIETGVDAEGRDVALPKHAQIRMCGNSVCPPIAAALVAANVPELARARAEAAE